MIVNVDACLTLVDANPDEFAARHGITPLVTNCDDCGAEKRTTIPFAKGRIRGLKAPLCRCGSQSRTYCLVAIRGCLFDGRGAG